MVIDEKIQEALKANGIENLLTKDGILYKAITEAIVSISKEVVSDFAEYAYMYRDADAYILSSPEKYWRKKEGKCKMI